MIRRSEVEAGRREAARLLERAKVRLSDEELLAMEVTDFGLGRWREEGAQIATFADTDRIGFKVICLLPGQTLPEHWHTSFDDNPGKEETLRAVYGVLRLYLPGEGASGSPRIPRGKESAYTCRAERLMTPPSQITLPPGMKHWFQAGEEGTVVYSISSAARCALDPFTDPEIIRVTKIVED